MVQVSDRLPVQEQKKYGKKIQTTILEFVQKPIHIIHIVNLRTYQVHNQRKFQIINLIFEKLKPD